MIDLLNTRDYIENCLKIRTKSGTVIPFRLNAAQRKLYDIVHEQHAAGKPVRIIILKARQLGFSTLTEGMIFHACATRKNVQALIVAHREDATNNLFRMSKLFYDELPPPVKPMVKASNAQELLFENPSRRARDRERLPGLRSRLRCATAGGKGIGRSDTLQYVHISEYAFWPEGPDGKAATLAGILQAVPSNTGTMVVIESTANGFEDFKERWDAAVAGENDFEAVFFAWYENPEYSMDVIPGTVWTSEEEELRQLYGLTDGQLTWRRWCIANNCGGSLDMFRQEYPASPEEAFLHSGTGVFDNELIIHQTKRAKPPVKRGRFCVEEGGAAWEDAAQGEVKIFAEPEPGVPYVLGGDTAGEGSDWFTAHVINNVTGEQVASLRRQYSEPEYVRQVYALGMYYNQALIGLETNFSTYPVMKLQELGYPNQYRREREDSITHQLKESFGFRTDRFTRPRAIAGLVEVFSAHPAWFRDQELLSEMISFCYNEDHRPEALVGKHDDLVMAAAITYAIRHQQGMEITERAVPPPHRLIDDIKKQQRRAAEAKQKKDSDEAKKKADADAAAAEAQKRLNAFLVQDGRAFMAKYPDVDIAELEKNEEFREFADDRYADGKHSLIKLYEQWIKITGNAGRAAAISKASKDSRSTSGSRSGGGSTLTADEREELEEWNRTYPKMKMTEQEFAQR